ncbi:ABC transporter ATP-binding protein [Vibrio genomosp. F10]|uniref:ABC transporter ATP-binding protein n=2 Tax=Vibrio genomosp. F10 TaxID=723171 RepID=A0A1B9QXH4_9VIBR|nr:ABC transporter ATP-binding protein [Vibrio genomosp. F10]OCH74803.1 ABC transporter ATP-binding protein [Vibrio genomosp. F10]OEE38366.1 ABC transporter ATP-binding protein [Vibrio genomosp. F10 str. ZF-129]OEE93692.1 ABC transporter ATP-binding protein [Vibrio genomosp. F10 str. 9ZC157]OEF09089.1 ABC transporter ATP-binding protein [Vibrio genomosp. F10 str. 9ZB36]
MVQITLNSLAHTYDKKPTDSSIYAIKEMNHVWKQGGAYALLGPSGCGKSTLLNIISGLMSPSQGEVLFDELKVNDLRPQDRNIAQVFQFPVIYDTMTVYDNLAFPLRNMKIHKTKVHSKVTEIAEILELTNVLSKKAQHLTADEKQKVSMGRGLVRDDVSAILFDEPLTVIDPQLKWKLRRKLKQIHQQFNITMIYVTHDQLEASTFADEIAVMYNGQIVQFGTPRELFERPNHTFVGYFIGSPGMNLMEVTPTETGVRFDDVDIPLSEAYRHAIAQTSSSNIKIGIRPEFVHIWEKANDTALRCKVLHVEDLGTYKIVTLKLGLHEIKARLQEDQVVPKDEAFISIPEQWTMLYVDEFLVNVGDVA